MIMFPIVLIFATIILFYEKAKMGHQSKMQYRQDEYKKRQEAYNNAIKERIKEDNFNLPADKQYHLK